MNDIPRVSPEQLRAAVAAAGESQQVREAVFEALRVAQCAAADPAGFRDNVRFPLISALLESAGRHLVRLRCGVVFEVALDSRIERALLLSVDRVPDHIWEPQTTKLLVALGRRATNAIIGGAYIGDHALLIARAMADDRTSGRVHAFEPMKQAYAKLVRNITINALENVVPRRSALWSSSNQHVATEGDPALASSRLLAGNEVREDDVRSCSIDDYISAEGLRAVELVMLDTEGGEEEAIRGAQRLLSSESPVDVIFEVHRSFVDWSAGLPATPVVRLLSSRGFKVFAIRDYHDNFSMAGEPVELIPAESVYLEGPPHGFNMLATREIGRIEAAADIRFVHNVSPKLLHDRDPKLHQPLHRSS